MQKDEDEFATFLFGLGIISKPLGFLSQDVYNKADKNKGII
jgi:hypothetical protein